ncbi:MULTISPECIES: ATP-grasp domain-containing protein [Bacillus cereus group]|uniref:ATP-grasp domain-containing protein n=1 Tax=Bacillus cereus group TaxID=86661 RepID=UPI001F57966F|nr:ATP-grasp domain-containing protein [Bacillus pacificus]MED0823863.1 ATP-grasp domain-containing protein [Bacillus pacificus]
MSKTEVILLIESGNLGSEIISIAKKGYKIIYLSSGILPFNLDNKVNLLEYIEDKNITRYEVLRDHVKRIAEKYNILTMFTTSDFYVYHVSKLSVEFNLNNLNDTSAYTFSKKHVFREKQRYLGYPYPDFHVLTGLEQGLEIIKNKEIQYIFKPINGNESLGVKLVSTEDELKESYRNLSLLSRFTNNLIDSSSYILEEYIEGKIYSCEFIKDQDKLTILGVTNRIISPKPYFIELGYTFPYMDKDINKLVIETTEKFITDFNYDFGPCHIEYIINENGEIYILEVNPRLVGWPNYWMINETLNCDIFSLINELYITGKINELNLGPKCYSTCLEVVPPIEGYFKGLSIKKEWVNNPDIKIIKNIDDDSYVKLPKSNRDIIARILTKGETMKDSKELALEVYRDLEIKFVVRSINLPDSL